MSTALYEIADDILKFERILEEAEDDEGLIEALGEAMAQSSMDFEAKVENIVHMMRNWDSTADAIKAEAKRLTARQKTFENKSDRLRAYLLTHLQRIDAPTLTLTTATVGRKKGSERTVIDDDLALPQGYFETEALIKPNKAGLKALWKATPEEERDALPGFHVERGDEALSIK